MAERFLFKILVMKPIIKRNILISIIFFILNIIFLQVEKYIKESTGEILYIILFLALLSTLIWVNKNTFIRINNRIVNLIAKGLLILSIFASLWIIVYFFNWYIYYPNF